MNNNALVHFFNDIYNKNYDKYYVKIDNIKEENEYYIFNIKNIKQLKPTLSVHMQIISNRAELIKFYDDILDNAK